jgi:rubrerythrin
MENTKTLEILKQAILLETRGKAFYSNVAKQSNDADVKKIFEIMAEEEDQHIKFLSDQFKRFKENKGFDSTNLPNDVLEDNTTEQILSERIKQNITAASFEAAAISAAIDMENRAIAVYAERAENASADDERNFYKWLAEWERGHHKLLYQLDTELKERIWNDNNFWPS